jgi:hypothetical protein
MFREDAWTQFGPLLGERLDRTDDPELWTCAVNAVLADATALCLATANPRRITAEVGRCSHWLRPHQTRWTADGGFAWPTGYDGPGFSRRGLPEWDWSVRWAWSPDDGLWRPVEPGRRPETARLRFRLAVPSRTRRHSQAAVHTAWLPGSPVRPRERLVQFYGFRRGGVEWATRGYHAIPNDRVYEAIEAISRPLISSA